MNLTGIVRKIPGVLYVILLITLVGSFVSPQFLQISNFSKIADQSIILLLIAIGMTLVIMLGEVDLSPGAVLSLASMVTALLQEAHTNFGVAIIAGVATGVACGLVNAIVIVKFKVPPFIATFGMMGMAQGISLGMRDAATIRGLDPRFIELIRGEFSPIPIPILIAFLCFLVVFTLLKYGKLGPYLFSMGTDMEAATYAGINVNLYRALPFVVVGLVAGIAGVLFAARLNLGHPTGGIGYEFQAIAAVVVGGNPLEGGRGSLVNTLFGVIFLSLLSNNLTMLGYPIWWQLAISGSVLILALLAPNILRYQVLKQNRGESA